MSALPAQRQLRILDQADRLAGLTDAQRRQISERRDLVDAWRSLVISFQRAGSPKSLATATFLEKHPGLSRATLYRNFADRSELLRALLWHILDRLDAKAQRLQASEGDGALFEFLRLWARESVLTVPLTDYWRSLPQDDPLVLDLRKRLLGVVEPLLQRAMQAGLCRTDLQVMDLLLIVGMFSAARRGRSTEERLALSERAWRLITEGLRPQAAAGAGAGV